VPSRSTGRARLCRVATCARTARLPRSSWVPGVGLTCRRAGCTLRPPDGCLTPDRAPTPVVRDSHPALSIRVRLGGVDAADGVEANASLRPLDPRSMRNSGSATRGVQPLLEGRAAKLGVRSGQEDAGLVGLAVDRVADGLDSQRVAPSRRAAWPSRRGSPRVGPATSSVGRAPSPGRRRARRPCARRPAVCASRHVRDIAVRAPLHQRMMPCSESLLAVTDVSPDAFSKACHSFQKLIGWVSSRR
jgi:hypothetical protein